MNEGVKNGCPICLRIKVFEVVNTDDYIIVRGKSKRIRNTSQVTLTYEERQKELLVKHKAEIQDLWSQTTSELWLQDRGKYMRIIKKIKDKESRFGA
jgi:hypothetical protein